MDTKQIVYRFEASVVPTKYNQSSNGQALVLIKRNKQDRYYNHYDQTRSQLKTLQETHGVKQI